MPEIQESNEQVLITTYLESTKFMIATKNRFYNSNLFRKQQVYDSKIGLVLIAIFFRKQQLFMIATKNWF